MQCGSTIGSAVHMRTSWLYVAVAVLRVVADAVGTRDCRVDHERSLNR